MIYTNKKGIAAEIYEAVVQRQKKYDKGEAAFSVTEIIDSPRISLLNKRHESKLEVDVSELLDSFTGHLLHDALERPETAERLYIGNTLSGAYDYYKDGVLKDYKTCSVWAILFKSHFDKWEKQLNVYAYMLRQKHRPVHKCGIEVFLRDWSATAARTKGSDYPQQPQFFMEFPLWDQEYTHEYLKERITIFCDAATKKDDDLPFCSFDEMWERPPTFAVMKKNQKRAVKLYDSMEEAESHVAAMDTSYTIDVRLGERTRCERFCSVNQFCNQYKKYVEDKSG